MTADTLLLSSYQQIDQYYHHTMKRKSHQTYTVPCPVIPIKTHLENDLKYELKPEEDDIFQIFSAPSQHNALLAFANNEN